MPNPFKVSPKKEKQAPAKGGKEGSSEKAEPEKKQEESKQKKAKAKEASDARAKKLEAQAAEQEEKAKEQEEREKKLNKREKEIAKKDKEAKKVQAEVEASKQEMVKEAKEKASAIKEVTGSGLSDKLRKLGDNLKQNDKAKLQDAQMAYQASQGIADLEQKHAAQVAKKDTLLDRIFGTLMDMGAAFKEKDTGSKPLAAAMGVNDKREKMLEIPREEVKELLEGRLSPTEYELLIAQIGDMKETEGPEALPSGET